MKVPMEMVAEMMAQIKGAAVNAGLSCDVPECEKFTLGFACSRCARKLCNDHGYWQIGMQGPAGIYCPYCVVETHRNLWSE